MTYHDGMHFSSPFETVNDAQVISSCEPMRNGTKCKPSSCCSSRIVIFILEEANNTCIWRMGDHLVLKLHELKFNFLVNKHLVKEAHHHHYQKRKKKKGEAQVNGLKLIYTLDFIDNLNFNFYLPYPSHIYCN